MEQPDWRLEAFDAEEPRLVKEYALTDGEKLALARVPPNLRGGLLIYREHGIRTGSYLQAVMAGDLFDAMRRGDPASLAGLKATVDFIHNHMPTNSVGSREALERWIERGGRLGKG